MIRRIVLALDDSAGSVAALRVAVELAAACGATLDVLTVIGDAVTAEALVTGSSSRQVLARRDQAAKALLAHAADVAGRAGVPTRTTQLCGEPARLILSAAGIRHADLVVLGRAGRPSAPGAPYIGSHTRQILEFAEQPVLVVPPNPPGATVHF